MTLDRIQSFAASIGVQVEADMLHRLDLYLDLLLDANARFNLTRITDPNEVEMRLIGDSLALIPLIPPNARRLLDIGSGGGVPGMPIAIVSPRLSVTLMDATGKKARFLGETASVIGVGNVTAVQGRAEEMARDDKHRERYDVVTARAVARLATLVELTLPFLRVGGRAILPKGSAAEEELDEARYAIRMLGGSASRLHESPVEGTRVVVIDKIKPTPSAFPRRTGIPNKTPLPG